VSKLADLVKQGNELLAQMEILGKKLEAEKDAAMRQTIQEEIDGKKGAFDQIKGKIDEEKASLERRKALTAAVKADQDFQTDVRGKDLNVAAQALDHDREEREKRIVFLEWMQGKAIPAGLVPKMGVESPSFQQGAGGIRIPNSVVAGIFGKSFMTVHEYGRELAEMRGKTYMEGLPQTSEDPCMTALIATEVRNNLLELPAERIA
jgi:hypothetical protein